MDENCVFSGLLIVILLREVYFLGSFYRFRFWYSFICQGTSTKRQRKDYCGLRA